MDSDDEGKDKTKASDDAKGKRGRSPSSASSSSRGSRRRQSNVPIDKVETLAQMARMAPDLQKKLKRGDLRPRELCDVAAALNRSKFFDGSIFELLAKELRRAFKKDQLGPSDTAICLCSLAELNAYDATLFEAACTSMMQQRAGSMAESLKSRLESCFRQVNHNPGEDFSQILRPKGRSDGREACTMFWRGQCKWGPKCKLSHDTASFEGSVRDGKWKPPSESGGKSVGFRQSADLFKADRCGALW